MSKFAELVQERVSASVSMTMERVAERAAEKLADEILSDPEFRANMRAIVTVAFANAMTALSQPSKPD